MDIRNIKIEAPELEVGHLEFIYDKGKEQLLQYMNVENLPGYPLDVNTRKSQVILKDFIGRVIEELFEGYESVKEAIEVLDPVGFNTDLLSKKDYVDVLNSIQNANEEQADALGFYVTLFVYSNILPEDIYEYCRQAYGKSIISLNEVLSLGASRLYLKDTIDSTNHRYPILDDHWLDTVYGDNSISTRAAMAEYMPGFNSMSSCELDTQMCQLWLVIMELNNARNLLKNRPWKQTEVMTKEIDFQESLVKSLIYYLGYLADRGFDQNKLVTLFNRKQALNMWRIKTGY